MNQRYNSDGPNAIVSIFFRFYIFVRNNVIYYYKTSLQQVSA